VKEVSAQVNTKTEKLIKRGHSRAATLSVAQAGIYITGIYPQ